MKWFRRLKNWIINKRKKTPIQIDIKKPIGEVKYFVRGEIAKKLVDMWESIDVKTLGRQKSSDIAWYIKKINQNKERYVNASNQVEMSSGKSIPWEVIAVLHAMEGSLNLSKQILNGERWNKKTKLVPKGYGPFKSFEESCLVGLSLKSAPQEWTIQNTLYYMELWNGLGYRRKGKLSPYLWSYSNHQEKGKYVRDHVYDKNAVSLQVGCAILLKEINYLVD